LLFYVSNHGAKIAGHTQWFTVLFEDVHQGEISEAGIGLYAGKVPKHNAGNVP
jgi:hypothetical protein